MNASTSANEKIIAMAISGIYDKGSAMLAVLLGASNEDELEEAEEKEEEGKEKERNRILVYELKSSFGEGDRETDQMNQLLRLRKDEKISTIKFD